MNTFCIYSTNVIEISQNFNIRDPRQKCMLREVILPPERDISLYLSHFLSLPFIRIASAGTFWYNSLQSGVGQAFLITIALNYTVY